MWPSALAVSFCFSACYFDSFHRSGHTGHTHDKFVEFGRRWLGFKGRLVEKAPWRGASCALLRAAARELRVSIPSLQRNARAPRWIRVRGRARCAAASDGEVGQQQQWHDCFDAWPPLSAPYTCTAASGPWPESKPPRLYFKPCRRGAGLPLEAKPLVAPKLLDEVPAQVPVVSGCRVC